MSFGVFQQLAPSAVVDCSTCASFTSPGASNLVLCRGERLEVYHLLQKQNRLRLAFATNLAGRAEALATIRPRPGAPENLVILFRRASYLVVLRYEQALGSIQTCGQHLLISTADTAASVLREGFQPKVAVDPEQRCLLVHSLPERLTVFPCGSSAVLRRDSVQLMGSLQFSQDSEQPSGLKAPYNMQAWSQLRMHHVEDVAFLGGYHQPTIACLGQAKPSWGGCISETCKAESSVVVLVLDLVQRSSHLIWASHGLEDDIFRIVPLPPPTSGVLAISQNAVTYLKEHGSSFTQALNLAGMPVDPEENSRTRAIRNESKLDILLANCSAVVLSPTVVLFSIHPTGRLYLAHLVLTGRDIVTDIVWTSPGQHSPAWELRNWGEDYVCLVDMVGSISVLKATVSKKKLPSMLQPLKKPRLHQLGELPVQSLKLKELLSVHEELRDVYRFLRSYTFEVSDTLPSMGPLQCLQPWISDSEDKSDCSTQRFLASSGSESKGSLYILQRAVPLEEQAEFDLPADARFSAVWALRQAAEQPVLQAAAKKTVAVAAALPPHRYVLISSPKRSMLLETTEEIEEISQPRGWDTAQPTLSAGPVLAGKLLVQLTPQRAFFMPAAPGKGTIPPAAVYPSGCRAVQASIRDPFIVLRCQDGSLKLLSVAEGPALRDHTAKLPKGLGAATWAALSGSESVRLTVLTPQQRGLLLAFDLSVSGTTVDVREVFRTAHLAEVPPVLRNTPAAEQDEEASTQLSPSLDYLRPITDVSAPLAKSSVEMAATAKAEDEQATAVCAEFVEVDPEDEGPTLIVLVRGRPVLIYRAFSSEAEVDGRASSPFPFSFRLIEHDSLGLVQSPKEVAQPYRPTTTLEDATGRPSGVIVAPPQPGIPSLWLAASRNRLYVHPLPSKSYRSFASLSAPCCGEGFFAVVESEGRTQAQVCSPASVEGLGTQGAFDLRHDIPCARHSLKQKPHCLATKPDEGLLGMAVSEMVVELPDVPSGPSMDEDPLSEDWSIIRDPPVAKAEPPPMPRIHPRYELWIETAKDLSQIGRYRFSFDNEEAVLCLSWVTIPGFPQPCLAVGTGVNTGEDLTCRGRLMLFTIKDKDPGILPPVYQRSLKAPVTVVGQAGKEHFLHSEGFKFFVEKWENSSFNKLALFDGGICMTSMSNIKNFMLFGDVRKGIDFCQWKEEISTGTRTIRRLSRSSPSTSMTVLACEFIVHQKFLGLVALDQRGNAHLYQYTPHSDGREGDQILRSCATFAMGAPCRAVLRLQTDPSAQSLLIAAGSGELFCLRPIDDQAYRTITTLLGMLFTRLPFRCGLNPRAFRSHDGPATLLTPRKNIEDAVLIRHFAFLSLPLQQTISQKMRLSVSALLRATAPYGTSVLMP